ncbi:acetate--CoA ligase family protein [Pseudonocardia acaciae]|uniref:acetate--CoA ligase family protein n=1 Tax=Pseudonocardia acaciae TaxID=551276 RepID=UPI000491F909|nr:acetate--CoA ligase family protein [Pseudonocardia acaciae]
MTEAVPHRLRRLVAPRSIAVVGATAGPGKAGRAVMAALADFPVVHPVHPTATEIAGRRVFAHVDAIPDPPELAVLVVGSAAVPDVLADCAGAGVDAVVVCAGGFAESGPDGVALQRRIRDIVTSTGIRLLGPNTSGLVNPALRACPNLMPSVRALRPGPVGIVAQSGGMNLALAFLLHQEGIGISLAAGLGNAVDVGFVDLLDHLAADEHTTAIALHVEGAPDGRALADAIRRATAVKPVVALKAGKADVGAFARSHTAALTGDWTLARAALTEAGAVVVDTPSELVDSIAALAHRRLPARDDPGVGVITGQAGPGLLTADQLLGSGLRLPELSETTARRLSALLPPLTYQRNPVDTGRPTDTFAQVVTAVAADDNVDATLVYALQEEHTPRIIEDLTTNRDATIFVTGGLEQDIEPQRHALRAGGIPVYTAPDRGVVGLRALIADARAQALATRRAQPFTEHRPSPTAPKHELDEDQAKTLLARLGLASPRRAVATTHAQARAAMTALGAPVVAKLCDARVRHKSDIDAVHTGISSQDELLAALGRIDAAAGGRARRYLIERQAGPGTELIVGAVRDPAFGPAVLLGLGGVDVEVLGRAAIRLAPMHPADAREMVNALPAAVRAGSRGKPPIRTAALIDLLVRLSAFMEANPHIGEIDINPLRVTADGLLALDALIIPS